MTDNEAAPIRVGIVGVNPDRGWATVAHLPALDALPGFQTVAVASTRKAGAQAVASRWGAWRAFDDPRALVACDDVDVVVVCVKTPDHAPVVRAAVEGGKHIYCEWPLGIDLAEARSLTALARERGKRHMIGMQAYDAPGARFVGDLVRQGMVGRVTGASLVLLTPSVGGHEVVAAMDYTADRRSGTNIMTTSVGHALAGLSRVLGDLVEVSAFAQVMHPEVRIVESGRLVPNSAPNEVAIIGRLASGAPVTIAAHGGTPVGAPRFTLHVIGTEGALVVRPARLGDSINVGDWVVTQARPDGSTRELPVPDDTENLLAPGPPKNIARMYTELGTAIRTGSPVTMDFSMALRFHEMVDAIDRSARSGRVEAVGRPG